MVAASVMISVIISVLAAVCIAVTPLSPLIQIVWAASWSAFLFLLHRLCVIGPLPSLRQLLLLAATFLCLLLFLGEVKVLAEGSHP